MILRECLGTEENRSSVPRVEPKREQLVGDVGRHRAGKCGVPSGERIRIGECLIDSQQRDERPPVRGRIVCGLRRLAGGHAMPSGQDVCRLWHAPKRPLAANLPR